MSSESVCQVTRSWVDVGGFHNRLFIIFMICTASVRNILDNRLYVSNFTNICDIDILFEAIRRLGWPLKSACF
jgi:hypothetical protein